jgi:hypothetical protein
MDTIANTRATVHELRSSRRGQNLLAPGRLSRQTPGYRRYRQPLPDIKWVPVTTGPSASPSHLLLRARLSPCCRRLLLPPRALRNKPHARTIALARARRLARIFPHDMPTRRMPALAKFFPSLTRTVRWPPFQLFLAHRAILPKTFPQFFRIIPLSQTLSIPELTPRCAPLPRRFESLTS